MLMSKIYFGEIPGVEEGMRYGSRRDLVDAGLHRSIQHGIDGNGKEGVAAIVVSGGYEDDIDWGDEIIYTGHGGNDPATKKQIANQSWDSHGNKGLLVSMNRKLPVRVIRGASTESLFSPKSGYVYGGLYHVVEAWEKIGKSGFVVCLFRLKKVGSSDGGKQNIQFGTLALLEPTGKEAKWFSIGVDAPKAQKLSQESKFAQELLDKEPGSYIEFGNGFKVLEVKKFLSS